jgi:hypothetical protein
MNVLIKEEKRSFDVAALGVPLWRSIAAGMTAESAAPSESW